MCCQRPYFHPPHFGFDPVFAQTQNDGYQEAADTKQFFFQALTSSTTSSHGHFEPVWALLISSFLFIFHSYSSFHFSCAHLCSILFFTKHYQPVFQSTVCHTQQKQVKRKKGFNFRASKLHVAGNRTDNKNISVVQKPKLLYSPVNLADACVNPTQHFIPDLGTGSGCCA